MRFTIFAALAVLLASCSTSTPPARPDQTPATEATHTHATHKPATHTPHIATASREQIRANVFGMPFDALLKEFAHDATKKNDGYLWVLKNHKPLFGLSDKKNLHERKVRLIYLVSPGIQVDDVHAGMSINALLHKYPGLRLNIGYEDQEMFTLPVGAQKMTVLAVVRSNKGGKLASWHGTGKLPYPTRNFSTAGHIDHFLIFGPSSR